jgi:hypothetical protein
MRTCTYSIERYVDSEFSKRKDPPLYVVSSTLNNEGMIINDGRIYAHLAEQIVERVEFELRGGPGEKRIVWISDKLGKKTTDEETAMKNVREVIGRHNLIINKI